MGQAKQTKGIIACICNKCGAKVDVPTARFYQPAVKGHFIKILVKEAVKNEHGKIITPAEYRSEFIAPKKLRHSEFGGGCAGTFKTADAGKVKSHKASRDRKKKSAQK